MRYLDPNPGQTPQCAGYTSSFPSSSLYSERRDFVLFVTSENGCVVLWNQEHQKQQPKFGQ